MQTTETTSSAPLKQPVNDRWAVLYYRKVCQVDVISRQKDHCGPSRIECIIGQEAHIRTLYAEFCKADQALAVELRNERGDVVERKDLLMDLADDIMGRRLDPSAVGRAILEPKLYDRPSDPSYSGILR